MSSEPLGWTVTAVRHLATNLDSLRVPKNASERADIPGDVPYWGANSVQGYVNRPLVSGKLVLIGEDGAPFHDPLTQVAFPIDEPIWPNNHVHVLRPKPGIDYRFLAAALNSVDYSLFIKGSTRDKLNQSELSSIPILTPPTEQQVAIADYLDRETAEIDAFIADQEKLIELLTERRSAVIAHAVFPTSNAAAPDHETLPLRRFGPRSESGTSVNASTTPAEAGEVGVLKTGAASSGVFLPRENKAVLPDEIHRVTVPVRLGTVVVNRANAPSLVGSIAYVNQKTSGLHLSDKLWQIEFARADARFVAFWAQTRAYRAQIESLSVGASSSMQNLSFGDFLGVRMPDLPRTEQEDIANRLEVATSEIDAAIADARGAIALSKERRAALISAAVTGKIDVRQHGKGNA